MVSAARFLADTGGTPVTLFCIECLVRCFYELSNQAHLGNEHVFCATLTMVIHDYISIGVIETMQSVCPFVNDKQIETSDCMLVSLRLQRRRNMRQDIKADIQNQIYEAGVFRPGEQIVVISGNCVLLELYTGKTFIYRMVDLNTMKAKHLFSKMKPIRKQDYGRVIARMHSLVEMEQDYEQEENKERASKLLVRIFTEILPQHQMFFRENQLSLALFMLRAMQENKVALCEAEVGTGKTHAYIFAAVVYKLFETNRLPAILSTSTIALQKAIVEEYLPQISVILSEHQIIDQPLTFVVRKGKSHYACDSRLKTYLSSIRHNQRFEDLELIEILERIFSGEYPIDLDDAPVTDYVKKRICVENCHRNCDLASVCRYRNHIRKAQLGDFDFQITNHNLVVADILSQKEGRRKLLPSCGLMIIDEAHKLLDAARQMYGITFESTELERLASSIYQSVKYYHSDKLEVYQLCNELLQENQQLFENLKIAGKKTGENANLAIYFSINSVYVMRNLLKILQRLSLLFYTLRKNPMFDRLFSRIEQAQGKLEVLLDLGQSICWLEGIGTSARLCTLPKQLDFLLYQDVWKKETPYILTSGTLSVGGDFSHYKQQIGLNFLESEHVLEVSKASPFDYNEHALLYLPKSMPFPDVKGSSYLDAVVRQIAALVRHTYGHTLVLFTSYRMMEMAYQRLVEEELPYPLFMMGRGRLEAIRQFRKSGNGILLASDSAGEGIDLPGDILSSLIVVKLPFPAPDPVMEYERTTYEGFHEFFTEAIMPAMLIKLRQWIGRGIRRESDTCVFSILDSRAGSRYRKYILDALPDMPVTDCLEDVGRFIREKKAEDFFS